MRLGEEEWAGGGGKKIFSEEEELLGRVKRPMEVHGGEMRKTRSLRGAWATPAGGNGHVNSMLRCEGWQGEQRLPPNVSAHSCSLGPSIDSNYTITSTHTQTGKALCLN